MKTRDLVVCVLLCAATNLRAAVLDSGFQETVYVPSGSGLSSVTGMGWSPDGSNRLFIIQQNGAVRVVQNGALLGTSFANISPINSAVQAGLLGLCFDPNYVVNRYVYFFVTVSTSEQRIVRLTDTNNVGANQTNFLSGLPAAGNSTFHNGGGIGFGFDGKIYWAIGEFENGIGVDSNLTSLTAKVGRANANGTVPADNPFVDGAGPNNDYIWARGLRNPFKMTFNPYNGGLWVNTPGVTYEQIFLVQRGDHAGWDNYENNQPAGFITPKIKYADAGSETRSIASSTGAVRSNNVVTFTTTTTHGFRQGEKITIAGVSNGSFNGTVYVGSVIDATAFTANQIATNATSGGGSATTQNLGGVVTGGCFYTSTLFPAAYRSNLFFCDYNGGFINRAAVGANNQVQTVDIFANGIVNAIDVSTGPDGALYYVGYAGTVYRAAYTNAPQGLIVQPNGLNMAEGGQGIFSVRLATAPISNVSVSVVRASGDSDLNVTNTTLTFTPANYATPQVVRVFANTDTDFQNDQAVFSVSASGLTSQNVYVNAYDVQGLPMFTSLTRSNGTTLLKMTASVGQIYVLDGSTNFLSWIPLSTNVATTNQVQISDASPSLRFRFYRARGQN